MSSSNSPSGNQIAGALTYPNSNGASSRPAVEQPRQPRNLQGLLRFAMEATKAEDAPGNSELGPLDDERRKFLEEAFRSLTVDVVQVLQNSIKLLSDQDRIKNILINNPLPEDVLTSFNNLLEYIDDMDVANDFYKLGGFSIFPVCFGSEHDEVRAQAYTVLAELCQNNPYCQARTLECGLLNVLLSLLASERGNALCKCLYAISCACRECPAACLELAGGGATAGWARGAGGAGGGACGALRDVLHAPELNARTKAAFFVRYLCQHCPQAREQFIQLNVVETIAEQLRLGRDESSEHLLSILVALTEEPEPAVLAQCRGSAPGLRALLQQHLLHTGPGDEARPEREACQLVLRRVFDGRPDEDAADDEADR